MMTKTYVHEEVIEAETRDAAILATGEKGLMYPEDPVETTVKSDAKEIPALSDKEINALRRWVTRVTYFDEDENGIAKVMARFKMRDENAFMDRVGVVMSHEVAKNLICGIIDGFAFPCEDYANDFDDPNSEFKVTWYYYEDAHTLEVRATIRT